MASFVYDNAWKHILAGNMDFSDDAATDSTQHTFNMVLVTSSYTPSQGSDEYYSTISGGSGYEAADTGSPPENEGYEAGGKETTPTVTVDGTNHDIEISFSSVSWTSATVAATAAVVYRDTGTDGTSQLLAYLDFGGPVQSTDGTYQVTVSTPLTINNDPST